MGKGRPRPRLVRRPSSTFFLACLSSRARAVRVGRRASSAPCPHSRRLRGALVLAERGRGGERALARSLSLSLSLSRRTEGAGERAATRTRSWGAGRPPLSLSRRSALGARAAFDAGSMRRRETCRCDVWGEKGGATAGRERQGLKKETSALSREREKMARGGGGATQRGGRGGPAWRSGAAASDARVGEGFAGTRVARGKTGRRRSSGGGHSRRKRRGGGGGGGGGLPGEPLGPARIASRAPDAPGPGVGGGRALIRRLQIRARGARAKRARLPADGGRQTKQEASCSSVDHPPPPPTRATRASRNARAAWARPRRTSGADATDLAAEDADRGTGAGTRGRPEPSSPRSKDCGQSFGDSLSLSCVRALRGLGGGCGGCFCEYVGSFVLDCWRRPLLLARGGLVWRRARADHGGRTATTRTSRQITQRRRRRRMDGCQHPVDFPRA